VSADPSPSAKTTLGITVHSELRLSTALRFPLQCRDSKRDIIIGGLWLLVPVIGWLLNMGHRVRVVHRMQRGESPWPAWERPGELLKHGCYTFLGMVWYGWPGVLAMAMGWLQARPILLGCGVLLWLLAVIAIPGYMSHYCKAFDLREIFNPVRALARVHQGGRAYWFRLYKRVVLASRGLLIRNRLHPAI
jgi:hypothetical protein